MSHHPSREELEKVWQSGSVGWLKNRNKNTKGKKPHTIVAKVYSKQYLDSVEITVLAKNSAAAMKETWRLSSAVREKYPHDQYKGITWSYSYKPE
jgi:hypothetical protein